MSEQSAVLVAPHRYSMSELIERAGVSAATVRFYLAEGLLPPPVKAASNRFLYDDRHVEVIRLVRLLRERRGLALETIRSLLANVLPDLMGSDASAGFRPEMWHELLQGRPSTESRENIRARLVEAGLVAFARHGYAEVSVDDVCRAASIAKGSFYRYFASKSELFFAAAEEAARRGAAELATKGDGSGVLLEQVADAVAPSLCIVLDLASLASQRRPGHARALSAYLTVLRDAIAPRLPEFRAEELTEVVEFGVARAVRRVTDETVQIPPGSAELE